MDGKIQSHECFYGHVFFQWKGNYLVFFPTSIYAMYSHFLSFPNYCMNYIIWAVFFSSENGTIWGVFFLTSINVMYRFFFSFPIYCMNYIVWTIWADSRPLCLYPVCKVTNALVYIHSRYIYLSHYFKVQLYYILMQTSGQRYFRSLAHVIQIMSPKLLSPSKLL